MSQDIVVVELDRRKNLDSKGNEYWRGRDLQGVLGYSEWRNFLDVVEKARSSCENTRS
jgi:DNA-damage-inducible protein D